MHKDIIEHGSSIKVMSGKGIQATISYRINQTKEQEGLFKINIGRKAREKKCDIAVQQMRYTKLRKKM